MITSAKGEEIMSDEVLDLITALSDGTMSLDDVAQRFSERSWPRRRAAPPANYLEMAAAAQRDPEPDIPGSFDEVDAAYQRGKLTDYQYDVLAEAMSEALRAEDSRNG
jgi:hypothetical protein